MDPFLVVVDDKSNPDFYVITTLVAKSGVKDGLPRREILSQGNALASSIHEVEQIPLTDAELQACEEYSGKQIAKFIATRAACNWNGIAEKIGTKRALPSPVEEAEATPTPK